ncbi:uncharacterized protein LOC121387893 [Gigantopelta aegis]|uniref:uncharacterized protein LOC121387893 n=1 Tax=Gigantopelta aegis TaxID=1735272 RepID=UPI001B889536|nr:uncharacterized protein LOC121387893 [Gigantopelta aegis]
MDYNDHPDRSRTSLGGTKTSQRVRRFQEHWKEQYPWVYYDDQLGKMFCRTCRDHADVCDPASAYYSGGCSNFQLMSLASHAKSKGHMTAEEVVRMQEYPHGVVLDWEDKSVMTSPSSASSSLATQASSSGISAQLFRRSSEVCSSGRDQERGRCGESDVGTESVVSSFNIGSSEDRIRLLRMAAEEAWRSVGPGSYNVPFSLDFTQAYDQDVRSQSTGITKRSPAPVIHQAFNTQMRIKTAPKVESVSPQSSNIPVGYPHTVQSPFSSSVPQRLNNLCLNAHAVAKKGLTYQDYKWMFELDKAKGCDVGETLSIKEYHNLQRCISETVQMEIVEAARRSKFLSVFCDRVSCVSSYMVVIYLKTVNSGKTFIHVLNVHSLNDELEPEHFTKTLSCAFKRELKDVSFDWKDHLVGFSCSNSTQLIKPEREVECDKVKLESGLPCGDDNGEVSREDSSIRDSSGGDSSRWDSSSGGASRVDDDLATFLRTNNPQITSLHCSAQMMNSACRDLKLDYHKHFEKLITSFCGISHLHLTCRPTSSSGSTQDRQAEILACRRPSQIEDSEWISCTLDNALFVIRNFSIIADCFKEVVGDERELHGARSRQCLQLMLTQRFVKYVHFLVDMLEVLSHVCHVITQPTASIGEVYEAICDAADNLMKLKKRSGQQLAKVEKEQIFCGHALTVDEPWEFERDKSAILTEITTYMTSRVPDLDESTMTSMTKLVCLSQWPSDTEHLKDYGEEDLLRIIDRFAPTFQKHDVITDKCLMEWSLLKNHIRRRFACPSDASWETVYPACKSKCENVLAVLSFILTLPGQSVDRELVYSYVDKLPAKYKKKLCADEMKHILRIFLHTPDVGEFDACASVTLYCDGRQSVEDSPIKKKLKLEKIDQWTSEDDQGRS